MNRSFQALGLLAVRLLGQAMRCSMLIGGTVFAAVVKHLVFQSTSRTFELADTGNPRNEGIQQK